MDAHAHNAYFRRISTAAFLLPLVFLAFSPLTPAAAEAAAKFSNSAAKTGTSASAASESDYSDVFDASRKGSVTLIYRTSDEKPVAGAAFVFYRVALFSGSARNGILTETYSSLLKMKNGSAVSVTASSKAEDLLPYVKNAVSAQKKKGGKVIRAVTGKKGSVSVKNLPPGVWLAYEETPAKGFLASEPFLFTLPQADILPAGDNKQSASGTGSAKTSPGIVTGWNYHLTIEPKASPAKETVTPTPAGKKPSAATSGKTAPVKTGDSARADLPAVLTLFALTLCMLLGRQKKRAGSVSHF